MVVREYEQKVYGVWGFTLSSDHARILNLSLVPVLELALCQWPALPGGQRLPEGGWTIVTFPAQAPEGRDRILFMSLFLVASTRLLLQKGRTAERVNERVSG